VTAGPRASVVIPAHNEARTIARLLSALRSDASGVDGDIEIVVVCNGCTDATAALARAADPKARVIEVASASKSAALKLGDHLARAFPRVYCDADVELTGADLAHLLELLLPVEGRPEILATAPTRILRTDRSSRVVRWYYEFWQRLPGVRAGLYGRGVIAVSAKGHARIAALPTVMADDLAMSEAFETGQTCVSPDSRVIIYPPRTLADLIRRRVRAVTGTHQVMAADLGNPDSRTTASDIGHVLRGEPAMVTRLPVFAMVTMISRARARRAIKRADFSTWQRDESSRS